MDIQQAIAALMEERQNNIPSRFPCRAIMVKNVQEYCELLIELKKINDICVVSTSDLVKSSDVLPKYDRLFDSKYSDKYKNKWVILTGVSEYLRLFSKNEAKDCRFKSLWSHSFAYDNLGRIIIPLWGCEAQWFDPSLHLNTDERLRPNYFDCVNPNAEEENINILVLSNQFKDHVNNLKGLNGCFLSGLKEWFEYWECPTTGLKDFILLTERYKSIISSNGSQSIHVIDNIFSFIKEYMVDCGVLSKENCSKEMQEVLFDYALKKYSLSNAILSALNLTSFSGNDVMGRWNNLPLGKKQLVKLWFDIHPDNTYLCHCLKKALSLSEVTNCLRKEIFKFRIDNPEWVKEYQDLSDILSLHSDKEFFKYLDNIPEYEVRLNFLRGNSRAEHTYLLKMCGRWMRKDSEQLKNCDKLRNAYPELYAYLCDEGHILAKDLNSYITRYKSYKLDNTLPDDEDVYFNDVETDKYEYRYSLLSSNIDANTIILWIDGLGIEWMSLLMWTLKTKCDVNIKEALVAMANLPTETCYNEQWTEMNVPYIKRDKLDKLAHKGVIDEPDYYVCIEEQLEFVKSIAVQVEDLLADYHRIIITGDHGTSRLAARFFHNRDGMPVPKNGKVCSHGRYAILPADECYSLQQLSIVKTKNGTLFGVFKNYDHFKQSGFAAGADDDNAIYGEIHGGATPEEMLVPVIVLDSKTETPLNAQWKEPSVKIFMKKAKFTLLFSKPVTKLSVTVSGISAITTPGSCELEWNVVLTGIKPGKYSVSVIADNHLLDLPNIEIKSALSGGNGDLP